MPSPNKISLILSTRRIVTISAYVLLTVASVQAFMPIVTPRSTTILDNVAHRIDRSSLSLSLLPFGQDTKDTRIHLTDTTDAQEPNNRAWIGKVPFGNMMGSALLALMVLSTNPTVTLAESSRLVGQIQGSGLVFKDTLEIESFDDPKVQGVTLYISNFQRPITERLSAKNFLQDPSTASVACAKTVPGPIRVADNIETGKGGEEVFEESKSLLFKTLRVQRIYDQEKNTVVYVSFNTRLDKNDDSNKSRFKSSICAVALD